MLELSDEDLEHPERVLALVRARMSEAVAEAAANSDDFNARDEGREWLEQLRRDGGKGPEGVIRAPAVASTSVCSCCYTDTPCDCDWRVPGLDCFGGPCWTCRRCPKHCDCPGTRLVFGVLDKPFTIQAPPDFSEPRKPLTAAALSCPCCRVVGPCDCNWAIPLAGRDFSHGYCRSCQRCPKHCDCEGAAPRINEPVKTMQELVEIRPLEVFRLRQLLKKAYYALEAVMPEESAAPPDLEWEKVLDVLDELKKEVGE